MKKKSLGMTSKDQTLDKVEGIDFDVGHTDGVEEFRSTVDKGYQWATGPDGSLFIYEKVMHKTFHIAVKDARIKAYSANYWNWVNVIEEVKSDD